MDKLRVVNQLTHLRNSLVMGLAADVLFHDAHAPAALAPVVAQMGDTVLPFKQIADALARPEARDQVCSEFRKFVFRGATAEPFELVEKYAAETKQMPLLEAAPWFPFAKLLRNTIRHGSIVFNTYLRSKLPITYRDVTISSSDEGRGLNQLVSYGTAIRLADDVLAYVGDRMA
jgi:hypothetical protein